VVNVSQIITLDKTTLTACVGAVSASLLKKVEHGIKLALALR
jgi:mRNA-degrading endonuclease toxin of MazEF toxin-antitoxin module